MIWIYLAWILMLESLLSKFHLFPHSPASPVGWTSGCTLLTSLAFSASFKFSPYLYPFCCWSQSFYQSFFPNLILSLKDVMKKSQFVIGSNTGRPVACLIASEYGPSSVHSRRKPRASGFSLIIFKAKVTTPGSTFCVSTFSPNATASNPSTSSQPTKMYL